MKTTTHTPGPWKIGAALNNILGKSGTIIAHCPINPGENAPWNNAEENARLIAAAPDLLDACIVARETLMRLIGEGVTDTADEIALASINRSIAKAEGNA